MPSKQEAPGSGSHSSGSVTLVDSESGYTRAVHTLACHQSDERGEGKIKMGFSSILWSPILL